MKAAKKAAPAKGKAKVESSDDESDESDDDKPKAAIRKQSNVSNRSASKKQTKK